MTAELVVGVLLIAATIVVMVMSARLRATAERLESRAKVVKELADDVLASAERVYELLEHGAAAEELAEAIKRVRIAKAAFN